MEIRTVDPRTLVFNPANPRRIKASQAEDIMLRTSIETLGLLTNPLVREVDGVPTIVAGERRVRAVLELGWPELLVVVASGSAEHDAARALSENAIRTNMNEVDSWRSISALLESGWSEAGVCGLFCITSRQLGQFKLLANILPAILDYIAAGQGPKLEDRATIANASLEEQAAVWKRHKPKKGHEVSWWEIVRALTKTRLPFESAAFDAATAERFGVSWTVDLFAPADTDGRFTEDLEAFALAQAEWMETHLPPNGEVIALDQYGAPQLPKKAERVWGKPQKGDRIGVYLERRSLQIKEIPFRMPKPAAKGSTRNFDAEDGTEGIELPKKPRAEISSKGVDMIGQYRTDALRETVTEHAAIADPWQLVGALVLALAGRNVRIESEYSLPTRRDSIAARIIVDGLLTGDVTALRQGAGTMLAHVLSAETGMRNSGPVALVVGHSFGADAKLPNMAHEDFLKTLSKDGITRAVRGENIAPRNTGKEMRAALIAQIGEGVWLHPSARFEPGEADLATIAGWTAVAEGGSGDDHAADEATDDSMLDDDEPETGGPVDVGEAA